MTGNKALFKDRIFTVQELAQKTGKSKLAIWKKCRQAADQDGIIYLNGSGYYHIRKPGKSYQLLKLQAADPAAAADIKKELIEILSALNDYVCEDCIPILNKVISNVN